jgi:hypothetical protein
LVKADSAALDAQQPASPVALQRNRLGGLVCRRTASHPGRRAAGSPAGKPFSKSERAIIRRATNTVCTNTTLRKPLTKLTRKAGYQKSTAAGKKGWQQTFLASLSEIPNVAAACDAAHISRAAAYAAKARSKAFAEQWESVCQVAVGRLEAECWKRATVGIKRGVWMKDENGKPVKVDEISEVSDGLAIQLLKAHLPDKYREPKQQQGNQ